MKYFLNLISLSLKVPTVVNAVDLGLLLKRGLMSSIERTLFPTESVKSVNILLLKKTYI